MGATDTAASLCEGFGEGFGDVVVAADFVFVG